MRKILLLLVPVTLMLASCDLFNNYGKKVKINDKISVYYKGDGVTEADAKKLGAFLEKNNSTNNELTAQIQKEGDAYVMRMPIKDEAFKEKEKYEMSFWLMQDQISQNVFDGKKTKIILTDEKLKDRMTLDDITRIDLGKGHSVYLKGNSVKEKDAKEIGEKLEKGEVFDYTSGAVLLTKEKGDMVIRFLPNEDKMKNKQNYYATLANYQYLIGKYLLDGDDVKLIVLDENLNDEKTFDELSDQEKTVLDQRMNGQQTEQQTDNTQYNQTQYNDQQTPVDNNDEQP